jgi:serine/threonine-protein kinase
VGNTHRPLDALLPRPGDVVSGKYRIDSILGTGGMGVVMGAQDLTLGRAVAIKFLSPAKAARPDAMQRFQREAQAAANLQSEHVVRVFDVGALPNGAPYIVMEQLRGMDLAQLLASRGGLPIDEAVDYVLQGCEALGEAHARGIVHRDLKPQNLFLTQRPDGSPCVKVLDFGISKAHGDSQQTNLTSTDVVMGTPLYMSPEQVRSLKNVDHRSDIWALGSILFELLTASPIYMAPSASALCAMIAMDPPTPLRARRPQAPEGLEQAILRCLHKDPMGRFQDVAALAEALTPFASERGRQSATRVSKVLRSGAPAIAGSAPPHPAASALEMGTTVDGSGRGSFVAPPPPGPSAFPPGMHPHPTTQQTWQENVTRTSEKRGGAVVVAIAGVLTGLLLLGGLGTAGYFFYWRGHAAPEATAPSAKPSPTAPVSVAAATVVPAAPRLAAPAAGLPVAPGAPVTPGAPKPAPAAPGPAAAKDAGAPASPQGGKDAGAPPGQPPGPAPAKPQDDLEARKRITEGQCNHQMFQMAQFDKDGKHRPHETARTMMCLKASGPDGKTCERAVCRQACATLDDKGCLMRLSNAERNFKPEY